MSRLKNKLMILSKKRDYTDVSIELGKYMEQSIYFLDEKYSKIKNLSDDIENLIGKHKIESKYEKFKSMLERIKKKCDNYSFKE